MPGGQPPGTWWSIYYPWVVIRGRTVGGWRRAPKKGVQVVRGPPNRLDGGGWIGVSDRSLWTGEPSYDPFGWGIKYGSTISDDDYWRIWCEAAYDGNPPESEQLHPMKRS